MFSSESSAKSITNCFIGPSIAPFNLIRFSAALKHAVKWQLISRNVADAVDPPKPGRYEAVILNPAEVDQVTVQT